MSKNYDNCIKIPNLRTWEPNSFFKDDRGRPKPFTAIFTASRNSGKSNMLKYLFLKRGGGKISNYFKSVVVFSETLANGFYKKFIGGKLFFNGYNPEVLRSLINIAKTYQNKGKRYPILVILDDCITLKDKYDKAITDVFTNGRHYYMSIFYITQKLSFVSTTWLNNCTLFIILRSTSRGEKKYISEKVIADAIDEYFPVGVKESTIYSVSHRMQTYYTKDYGAIVVTPFAGNSWEEKIFKFKAENVDKLKVNSLNKDFVEYGLNLGEKLGFNRENYRGEENIDVAYNPSKY